MQETALTTELGTRAPPLPSQNLLSRTQTHRHTDTHTHTHTHTQQYSMWWKSLVRDGKSLNGDSKEKEDQSECKQLRNGSKKR